MALILALLLGCGRASGPAEVLVEEAEAAVPPARLADPPGFQAIGPAAGPAPVYVTLSLNINDFLRVEREAQAVRRFLDATHAVGADPVELSFTGEVLDALEAADPALIAEVKARRPTVNVHDRVLQYRRLQDTEHMLFRTDTATLALDRTRPGPLVHVQQAFGVTPRDEGGAAAELLRRRWTRAPGTVALLAAGVTKVARGDLVVHPDRLVAAALDPATLTPGHEFVDAYAAAYRQMARVRAGEKTKPGEVEARFDDLARWAHVAKLQGFDVARLPDLTALLDPTSLGQFLVDPGTWLPTAAERAALRARAPADAASALDRAFAGLCAWTCDAADPAAEVTARLDALDPGTAYIARLTWHASNDYTVDGWGRALTGPGPWDASRLRPAATRPVAEQARIAATYDAVIAALARHPRVRFVSVDNDTQWAAENAPAAGWKAAFGVDLAAFPEGFDAAAIDAAAEAAGVRTRPPPPKGKRPPR